jgi:hypothetical protein
MVCPDHHIGFLSESKMHRNWSNMASLSNIGMKGMFELSGCPCELEKTFSRKNFSPSRDPLGP